MPKGYGQDQLSFPYQFEDIGQARRQSGGGDKRNAGVE